MEKRKPHYVLNAIKAQMATPEDVHLSVTATSWMRAKRPRMGFRDVWDLIQGTSQQNFYKSMTTERDPTIWQDVYHVVWKNEVLYMKFQHDPTRGYFVISLKEK